MARPLVCPRCGGNVYAEPDFGGHIIDLRCLLCHRSPGEYTREEFAVIVGRTADVERASTDAYSFLWVGRP
jgi:hypothetical protein